MLDALKISCTLIQRTSDGDIALDPSKQINGVHASIDLFVARTARLRLQQWCVLLGGGGLAILVMTIASDAEGT